MPSGSPNICSTDKRFTVVDKYENSLIQHQNVEQRMVEVMLLAHRKFSINTEPGADLLNYYVYKPSFS